MIQLFMGYLGLWMFIGAVAGCVGLIYVCWYLSMVVINIGGKFVKDIVREHNPPTIPTTEQKIRAQYLSVFSGEVLKAFSEKNVFIHPDDNVPVLYEQCMQPNPKRHWWNKMWQPATWVTFCPKAVAWEVSWHGASRYHTPSEEDEREQVPETHPVQ